VIREKCVDLHGHALDEKLARASRLADVTREDLERRELA
jgi:hypothetical protein